MLLLAPTCVLVHKNPPVLAMATADDSAAASSPAEGVDKEVCARHTASLCTSELPTHAGGCLFRRRVGRRAEAIFGG